MEFAPLAHNIKGQQLHLLPEKAIFWEKKKILLVADLHIGKSTHFRKQGIAVPGEVAHSNLSRLDELIRQNAPEHIIILGDLFHSDLNKEWQQFIDWRKTHRQLEMSLVIGNHDILNTDRYHSGRINVFKKMVLAPFLLVHDINSLSFTGKPASYVLSGHIHPAAQLNGKGRQAIKFPCFYFGDQHGILPAFGAFTGTHVITPKAQDNVFIIANSQIISAN